MDKMISQLGKPRNKNSKRLQMIYILFCAMLGKCPLDELLKLYYACRKWKPPLCDSFEPKIL